MTNVARPTPYGLVFGAGFGTARFATVRAQEAEQTAETRETLLHLPAAGALLRELLPPATAGAAHSDVVEQVSALLFHAYRYWRAGQCLYRVTAAALTQALVSDVPDGSIDVPGAAGYVQLPRTAIWARVADAAPHEPLDGFFWSAPAHAPDTCLQRLDLLLVLGMRAGRAGFSTVTVSATPANLTQWARTSVRPDGADFENVLPGGELQGYRALTTRAEAIKLAALCFRYIQRAPEPLPVTEHDGDTIRTVDG